EHPMASGCRQTIEIPRRRVRMPRCEGFMCSGSQEECEAGPSQLQAGAQTSDVARTANRHDAGGNPGVASVQVKISVRHGHLGDNTQSVIREKALKLLQIFDRLTMIEVTVDVKKTEADKARVEFVVQAEHKHDFVAQESHHDVVAAVDLVLHKLQMQ